MIIKLKNKDTLICDDFQFKCSIGKNGLKKNKIDVAIIVTPIETHYKIAKFFLVSTIYYGTCPLTIFTKTFERM